MHDVVFYAATCTQLALFGALLVFAAWRRSRVERILSSSTIALVMVAIFVTTAIAKGEAGYLDIGIVLAMLGFVQTVATARLLERCEGEL